MPAYLFLLKNECPPNSFVEKLMPPPLQEICLPGSKLLMVLKLTELPFLSKLKLPYFRSKLWCYMRLQCDSWHEYAIAD